MQGDNATLWPRKHLRRNGDPTGWTLPAGAPGFVAYAAQPWRCPLVFLESNAAQRLRVSTCMLQCISSWARSAPVGTGTLGQEHLVDVGNTECATTSLSCHVFARFLNYQLVQKAECPKNCCGTHSKVWLIILADSLALTCSQKG